MHGQQRLLPGGLHRHEAHVGPTRGLTDGGRIVGVVLALPAAHAIGRDKLGRDESRSVAEGNEPPGPVVRTRAGFHGDDARRHSGQHLEQLIAPHGARQQHLAGRIDTVHGKYVLG